MDETVAELRAELVALPRERNTQPYPKELRERVVAFAARARDDGAVTRSLAGALGLRAETLRRWLGEPEPVRP